MEDKRWAGERTLAVKWRRAAIYNRTNAPLEVFLRQPNTDSGVSMLGRQVIGAATTFVWGLKVREELEASFLSGGRLVGSANLCFSSGKAMMSVIVDYRGVRSIAPSQRRAPGIDGGIMRVQVGCGPHNLFPDWWNVDIRKFPGIDAAVDVTQQWPYKNLEFVYGEQFLEHLDLDGALKFLISAGRSLKRGGVLRLTTPNLEWVLKTHYANTTAEADIIRGTLAMNRAFHGWGHKFLYSQVFLEALCRKVGYADVRFYRYGESGNPELANLERHGGFRTSDGMANHIVIEAEVGDPDAMSDEWRPYLYQNFLKYYFGGH